MNGRSVVAFIGVSLIVASAAFGQKEVSVKPDKTAVATENVKQLLLLMDTDKNGKISKQEWLRFMDAEFDRLDTDKSGELRSQRAASIEVHSQAYSPVGSRKIGQLGQIEPHSANR